MIDSADGGEGGGDELPCATEGEGGEDCVCICYSMFIFTNSSVHKRFKQ